jgi:hypothetical protein
VGMGVSDSGTIVYEFVEIRNEDRADAKTLRHLGVQHIFHVQDLSLVLARAAWEGPGFLSDKEERTAWRKHSA